jgi:hypothetical protein
MLSMFAWLSSKTIPRQLARGAAGLSLLHVSPALAALDPPRSAPSGERRGFWGVEYQAERAIQTAVAQCYRAIARTVHEQPGVAAALERFAVTVDQGEIVVDLGDVVVRGQLDERGRVGLGHGLSSFGSYKNHPSAV